MLNVDQIRSRQEQRLARSLESWKEAKEHLEKAIALAENKERELHEVSEDVRRKLAALDLVIGLANEPDPGPEIPVERRLGASDSRPMLALPQHQKDEPKEPENAQTSPQTQSPAPDLHRLDGVLKKSSRPLFSPQKRSGLSALSILQ
jgi:hypothetical protein